MLIKDFLLSNFPHRWLDRNKKGTKRLFDVLSKCLSFAEMYSAILLRNSKTRTAVELLPLLEEEYGVKASNDIYVRRAMIIAKKRTLDCPVTMPDLISMFQALQIIVDIELFYNQHLMKVSIEENPMEISFGTILNLLDENIRAHVGYMLEMRSNMDLSLYNANYVESYGSYTLNVKLADFNVSSTLHIQSRLEICMSYYLEMDGYVGLT